MKEIRNAQRDAARMMVAIGRLSRRLTGDRGLLRIIEQLRNRPQVSVPDDLGRLDGHRQTAELILHALELIGGKDFQREVLDAAEMPNHTGDWENALRATVRAYARVRTALVTTTDRNKILGLVRIRIVIA